MLKQSLTVKVQTKAAKEGRGVEVEIVASKVGHRVPTGFVDRHLVLLVDAVDADGRRVNLVDGAKLGATAGAWKDRAGFIFAKQLIGDRGRTPMPFWLPVSKTEDTRLRPERPDRRKFTFEAAAQRVTVQVWYRRFWPEVAAARGWTDNDLLVVEKTSAWK
jgi:hypothetical protein